jgi:hypothetical protein
LFFVFPILAGAVVRAVFGYSSQTWKGKAFETMVHYVFIALWSYLRVVVVIYLA